MIMAQMALQGKLMIDAVLTVKTGLHIGNSSDFSPIGAVDSPFIRDPVSRLPMIPGSSLKGKMRTLLAKSRDEAGEGGGIADPAKDEQVVSRLFGYSSNQSSSPARLQFSDIFMEKDCVSQYETMDMDTYFGEIKFENTISRMTGVADLRQIERVPAGMRFVFHLIYNLEKEEEFQEDMNVLADGFRLLQADYLGGHGSRGYGRVGFSGFSVRRWTTGAGHMAEEPEDQPDLSRMFEEARL